MKHTRTSLILLFATLGILSIHGCKKSGERPSDETGNGVRLKHLTATGQVAAALDAYMQGYQAAGDGSFTNTGRYPDVPHSYYYTVNFKWDIDGNAYAWRSISSQAGMGKDTKAEILAGDPDAEEVLDGRLGKPPYENVFAIRYRDNDKDNWWYELHLRLAHINQDNQVISFSGSFGPTENEEPVAPEPPSSAVAISAMLTLVEPIDTN